MANMLYLLYLFSLLCDMTSDFVDLFLNFKLNFFEILGYFISLFWGNFFRNRLCSSVQLRIHEFYQIQSYLSLGWYLIG
jgi:hypothetical protein